MECLSFVSGNMLLPAETLYVNVSLLKAIHVDAIMFPYVTILTGNKDH